MPPTALSSTALWNVCPAAPLAHGSDCYYPTDQPFPGVVGNATVVLRDLPSGPWEVVLKGDALWKVSVGVFDYANLTRAAASVKARASELGRRLPQQLPSHAPLCGSCTSALAQARPLLAPAGVSGGGRGVGDVERDSRSAEPDAPGLQPHGTPAAHTPLKLPSFNARLSHARLPSL